jgi:hypothetical protein
LFAVQDAGSRDCMIPPFEKREGWGSHLNYMNLLRKYVT